MNTPTTTRVYTALLVAGIAVLSISINVKAASPLNGKWYNAYCSQVEIEVDPAGGEINGVYTSHTGSTGSSILKGLVKTALGAEAGGPTNPNGIPFSMGIQWRLINQPITEVDGSWHWVSTFSGQYHPRQTVEVAGQLPYQIEETLEILNGLIATATVEGFTNVAPVMWPQTLHFHRHPPSYCLPVDPPLPEPYTATAEDYVSGTWKNQLGEILRLTADLQRGTVKGSLEIHGGNSYDVIGLLDTIAKEQPVESTVVEQGVTLSLVNPGDNSLTVLTMSGGVNLAQKNQMNLWTSEQKSTSWTNRFTQLSLEKVRWVRQ